MNTPLTDSINALTAYANETTGAEDTTLSDAVGRLCEGYGADVKHGTFVGEGKVTTEFYVGFKPDIVYVSNGYPFAQSGWAGIGACVIIRGLFCAHGRHNNTSTTSANTMFAGITDAVPEYGSKSASFTYGSYDDETGEFTISNGTNNVAYFFTEGATYNWTAIKLAKGS